MEDKQGLGANWLGWNWQWLNRPLSSGLMAAMLGIAAPFTASAAPPPGTDVLRATLTNGLRVVIVPDRLAPVATTVINYRVGSDQTPADFPGTAHALEHMMFRGSPGLNAAQLADISAALGGDSNADTQQAVTQYFFTVPAEDLELPLHIEAIRMQGLSVTPKEWELERGAIEQEVAQDLSNPEYVFYKELLEVMFKGSPYAHDALGSRPSFNKTTAAMLRQFHQTWYGPNNAILIIVGNLQAQEVLKTVRRLFESIPPRARQPEPEFHFQAVTPRTIRLDTDLPYGLGALVFRFPGSDSPDYAAAQLLADILSSQRGDLYGLVAEGKALECSFAYEGLPKAGLGYAAAAFPAGSDPDRLLREIRSILLQAGTNSAWAELLDAAKRREILNAELERNSIPGLAMEWSQAVAVEGRESPEDDVESIRRVTLADVRRVAKQYLDFEHVVTAILTPQTSGKPISPKGFGGRESFAPKETKPAELPNWAKSEIDRLQVPTSALHPKDVHLENGLRLIIQPESISDTVSLYGRIKSNPKKEASAAEQGLDVVLDELLSFGTVSLDRLEFQKALDEIGAIESPGTNFSLQVLPAQFERGVQLLAENLLHPALPGEALEMIKPQLVAAVAGELQSPAYLVRRALEKALFPKNDPVQLQTTPETMKTASRGGVQEYYHRVFRPDLTTIVVIGNIAPEAAESAIRKYFGTWQSSGPKPDILFPPAPTNSPAFSQVPDASRVQDKVVLAQTLSLVRTNPDFYPLELGNHVLGGAFYATRLYRDLRENAGLVYSVSSQFNIGESRGTYSVEYACDPPNVSKARNIVVSNLRDLQLHNVSAAELRQAKVLLLREIPLGETSTDRIASGWLARSMLGLPLDEPVRAGRRYHDLTADDVRTAFARWLRPSDLVEVTQGPPPK